MTTSSSHREKTLGTISPIAVPINQLPVVELNAEYIRRSSELALDRNESYRNIDGGTVFGNNDALTSHQTGILGEMAVAELYATDIDAETYEFGDGGVDLDLWDASADVKSTTTNKMQYPQLLICEDNPLSADLYFVAHIINWGPGGAQVRVHGYATQEQVESKTPYRHPGTRKNYVVDPEELTLPPLVQVCHG
ncbi:hypothetical protein [Natronomonas salsuginis]|uniref:Uncharacterized protein n=1 Tax=Natronomonas salsuginis TaxID=2217661 RepID=A0A4U5JGN9_9EURY|nr:hypothetical protein [Natronomonas salsuginis]TKR27995.1 hypothetical protein DM868_02630 [Natronomonas salsuginis]